MKTLTAVFSLAALATGTAGAAIAYVSTAPGSSAVPAISVPAQTPEAAVATAPRTKVKVKFRKCRSGARLEHGTCVHHVVHTVVQPAPAVAPVTARPASNQSSGSSRGTSGSDEADHPEETRHEVAESSEDEDEGRDEAEGSEDHASEDAPRTGD